MKNTFIISLLLILLSCSKEEKKVTVVEPNTDILSDGITKTGIDLFKALAKEEDENLLFSPLSIHTALSMTLQGADGGTLSDMKKVLNVNDFNSSSIGESYKLLNEDLISTNDSTTLNTSNATFYDPSRVNIFNDFSTALDNYFGVETKSLNFDDQNATNQINDWVANTTQNRIKKVIDEIKDNEILFIINALYFIGDWDLGFSPQSTRKLEFNLSDNSTKEVDMMTSDEYRNYYNGDEFAAIDIDFKGNEYAMSFIMPKTDPLTFISTNSSEELFSWYKNLLENQLQFGRVMTHLPKFEVSSKYLLNDALKDLGMQSAFENANFFKMGSSPLGPLYISRVLHDAFIKVDEKGVEGAAVTTVGIGADSAPPFINFNKPFFFILRHKDSKIPVFIGILNNPQ